MISRCASSLSLDLVKFEFQCRSQCFDVFIGSRKYIACNDNVSFLPSKGGRRPTLLLLESPPWSNSHTLFNPMSLFFFGSHVTEKTFNALKTFQVIHWLVDKRERLRWSHFLHQNCSHMAQNKKVNDACKLVKLLHLAPF